MHPIENVWRCSRCGWAKITNQIIVTFTFQTSDLISSNLQLFIGIYTKKNHAKYGLDGFLKKYMKKKLN